MDWYKLKEGTKALLWYLLTQPLEEIKHIWRLMKREVKAAQKPMILVRATSFLFIMSALMKKTSLMWFFLIISLYLYLIYIVRSGEHRRRYKERKVKKYIWKGNK